MKMCYRGVSYDYQPVVLNLSPQQRETVYRVVGYSSATKIKFLGRVYQKSALDIAVAEKKVKFLGNICDRDSIELVANTTNQRQERIKAATL